MKKKLIINDREIEVDIISQSSSELSFIFEGKSYSYTNRKKIIVSDHWNTIENQKGKRLHFLMRHGSAQIHSSDRLCKLELMLDNQYFKIDVNQQVKQQLSGNRQIYSPLPGKIIAITKKDGDLVNEGDEIIRLEAMKMEHRICAETKGIISLKCKIAQQIIVGDILAEIDDENG